MIKLLNLPVLLLLYLLATPARAQEHSGMHHQTQTEHKMINQDELQWQEGPSGLPSGAKIAILAGDPAKEGPFTVRIMFPENYKIAPHWHPTVEHVTVLDGTLYMGTGEKLDMNSATMLSVGGFAVMPAKFNHYAFTKGKTVIQLHSTGPFQINYINAADDPRNKTIN